MPNLVIRLSETQLSHVRAAVGALNKDAPAVPASQATIEAWLTRQLRARVRQYEESLAAVAHDQTVDGALRAEGW